MISSSYNNGVSESRSYNDNNTLASINYSGAPLGDLSYTWDENENKTGESIGGVMSGYGFTAGYDAEDRLVSWDRADTNLDQSWALSPVGNWSSITENASVQHRTHGPVHELLTAAGQAIEHDPKGNMTQIPPVLRPGSDPLKLKWDFENRLRAADTDDDGIDDVFYRWDALGRRVARHMPPLPSGEGWGEGVIYFQDGQQTLADYAAGTAAGSPTYTYVYASYIDEPVMRGGSGGLRYYHRNQQYSITALSDGGGSIVERYAYTGYGQLTFADASGTVQTASMSNNRYTHTGRERDDGLSLYHYRARMYDAAAGRFCSRDPIGYAEGFSRYASKMLLHLVDALGFSANEADGDCPSEGVYGTSAKRTDQIRWVNNHALSFSGSLTVDAKAKVSAGVRLSGTLNYNLAGAAGNLATSFNSTISASAAADINIGFNLTLAGLNWTVEKRQRMYEIREYIADWDFKCASYLEEWYGLTCGEDYINTGEAGGELVKRCCGCGFAIKCVKRTGRYGDLIRSEWRDDDRYRADGLEYGNVGDIGSAFTQAALDQVSVAIQSLGG